MTTGSSQAGKPLYYRGKLKKKFEYSGLKKSFYTKISGE